VADQPAARGDVEIVEPGEAAQEFARRVAESKATIPHVYLEAEAELAGLAGFSDATVIHACARALREHPRVNGRYRDGSFELYSRVNIGVAVAASETLVFVTIADADRKNAGEIASELERLAARARSREITQPELSGATFSFADPGSHGITRGGPAIVNRGQAATLTVGTPREHVIERQGELATVYRVALTLACDNRILQGPEAPAFLARVRELLEAA
jgi:pyruvate dehydrogenase E2 component (dihydrolipoamide acetyltransferase)